VKETILVEVHTNSVSMPSALAVDDEAGWGLRAMRAGSVNERRMVESELVELVGTAAAAAGGDMAAASLV
jgi:hypothetical protein